MIAAFDIGLLSLIVILSMLRINAMSRKTCIQVRFALVALCVGAFAVGAEAYFHPHDWYVLPLHGGLLALLMSDRRTWN